MHGKRHQAGIVVSLSAFCAGCLVDIHGKPTGNGPEPDIAWEVVDYSTDAKVVDGPIGPKPKDTENSGVDWPPGTHWQPCGAQRKYYGIDCDPSYCEEDQCEAGQWCEVGTRAACQPVACDVPVPATPAAAWKVIGVQLADPPTYLAICDHNADGKMELGLNNALKPYFGQSNSAALAYLKSGEFVRMFVPQSPTSDGAPFAVHGLAGTLAQAQTACDPVSAVGNCALQVSLDSYAVHIPGRCKLRSICTATLLAGAFKMQCPGVTPQPVLLKPKMNLPAYKVAFVGELGADGIGTLVTCGAFRKADMLAAIEAVPDRKTARYGGKSTLVGLAGSLAKPDVDTDGDGEKDALGFAAVIKLAPATIVP